MNTDVTDGDAISGTKVAESPAGRLQMPWHQKLLAPFQAAPVLWLVVALPFLSVVMGGAILVVATAEPGLEVEVEERVLSKTSWREQ